MTSGRVSRTEFAWTVLLGFLFAVRMAFGLVAVVFQRREWE